MKKRQEAQTQFEKIYYKILNTSVFGKMMEDQQRYLQIELVNNAKPLKKIVAKPSFESLRIFDNNLVTTHLYLETVHKKCLTAFDDKRYILPDGSTYAFSHYKILNQNLLYEI